MDNNNAIDVWNYGKVLREIWKYVNVLNGQIEGNLVAHNIPRNSHSLGAFWN